MGSSFNLGDNIFANIPNNAIVLTEANLPSSAEVGAIYATSDTNKIFVGNGLGNAFVEIQGGTGGGGVTSVSDLANGSVSDAEFECLNGVTSNIQDQIDGIQVNPLVHSHGNKDIIDRFSEVNGVLEYNGDQIITSNISTNIAMYQPSGSPVTISQGQEVTVSHPICTNEKIIFTVYEEEAGATGLTNLELDFDLADRSKFVEQDAVNGTDFVGGKVQLKATGTSNSIYKETSEIPTMTSNTTPSGTVSASSVSGAGYEAYKSCDGNSSSSWLSSMQASAISDANPQYIMYDFGVGNKKTVKKYTIRNMVNAIATCSPVSWKLQGSNDGNNFVDLHTVTDSLNSSSDAIRAFTFNNTTPYQYYRLRITKSQSSTITTWDAGTTVAAGVNFRNITQLANGDVLITGESDGKVYKSTDGGATWDNGTFVALNAFGITQTSNGNIYITTLSDGKVYKSTDGGATWDNGTFVASDLRGISVINGNVLMCLSYSDGKVYKSTDGGATWDNGVGIASGIYGIMQLANGDILISRYESGHVYKSTDGGATWSILAHTGISAAEMIQLTDGTVVAISPSSSMAVSKNNGVSWSSPMTISGASGFSGIVQLTNGDILVSTYYTSKVFKSTEGTSVAVNEIAMFEGVPTYPTVAKYITTTDLSHFNLAITSKINSVAVTETVPTNTSIKAFVSFDGRATWKYYNGDTSTFVTAPNGLSDLETLGNTLSFLASIIVNLPTAGLSYLDFAISLNTSDATVTPSLDQITYNYDESTHFELATVGRYSSSMDYGVKRIDPETTKFKKLSTGTSRVFVNVIV